MSDAPISRVVVRPPNWLGDAILALPAIAAVRARFANAHLTIASTPAIAALFRETTDARPDRVIELPDATNAAVAALRGGRFDLGVLFPNSFRSAWQFRRAGIPQRWGYATSGRGILLTKRAGRAATKDGRHQSDYYRALARGLECPDDASLLPRVTATRASVDRADALLAERGIRGDVSLVGAAPGAAYGQAKQWPPDRMASALARLVVERDRTCVVVGASHDRPAARAIESWLRANAPEALPRVIDLVGRTSLGALTGVIARCDAFVSNDSGAMHLAAAVGRPVVAIFGPTNEQATGPIGDAEILKASVFCRPCMLRECPIDHRCMKRISVDDVVDAIARHLPRGAR